MELFIHSESLMQMEISNALSLFGNLLLLALLPYNLIWASLEFKLNQIKFKSNQIELNMLQYNLILVSLEFKFNQIKSNSVKLNQIKLNLIKSN